LARSVNESIHGSFQREVGGLEKTIELIVQSGLADDPAQLEAELVVHVSRALP
jgi:hypothetical protein